MTEQVTEEEDFEYGDYDLEEDVTVVPASEALPYYDVAVQDDGVDVNVDDSESKLLSFTSVVGKTPGEAIATARSWVLRRLFFGVGRCLATIRQAYNVPSKYGTATASWQAANHKHFAQNGQDVPRGAPVWWTGGSTGAGHVAISIGGGRCISTDWKEPGRLAYAIIDDITRTWNLDFKGWTRELNDVVVWRPAVAGPVVHLSKLVYGARNSDVLQLKKRLHAKGYKGFLLSSNKYGRGTKKAYATYQRRLGYSGSDANGIPGRISLRKLGFVVKA